MDNQEAGQYQCNNIVSVCRDVRMRTHRGHLPFGSGAFWIGGIASIGCRSAASINPAQDQRLFVDLRNSLCLHRPDKSRSQSR